MIKKQYIKLSLLVCISFGIIFSISALSFEHWSWFKFVTMFLFGITIGGLFIPELEPKATKKPVLFQTIVGAIGGSLLAVITTDYNPQHLIIGLVAGTILGISAQFWIKYIPMP